MKRSACTRLAAVFILLCAWLPERGSCGEQPSVLFIISDDLTTALGCYGHPQCKTPNIDRIARRGVRFDKMFCMNPVCGPARASLMTGRYPAELGCYSNKDSKSLFENRKITGMTEPFREAGYFAARVSKVYHMGIPGDIVTGSPGADHTAAWDVAVNIRDPEQHHPGASEHLTPKMKSAGMAFKVVETEAGALELADGKAVTKAIELLQGHGDRPFFLAVGLVRPHVPLVAPSEFFNLYPLDTIELPQVPENDLGDIPEAHQFDVNAVKYGMNEEQQRKAIRGYYASVTYLDAQVGRLLDELERLELDRSTIVVFTSDHGYHLGEHNMWQKQSLMENVTRVPFIVSVPWLAEGHGKACSRIAEHIDLFPTLTDLCGVATPAGLPGESMCNLLQDPLQGRWNKGSAYTLNSKGGESVRSERFRLTVWHDGNSGIELYDLKKDPGEFTNLAGNPEHAAELQEMRMLLEERRRGAGTDVKAYLEKVPPAFDKGRYLEQQKQISDRKGKI
jgi:arylsulfatase A-like enzyme